MGNTDAAPSKTARKKYVSIRGKQVEPWQNERACLTSAVLSSNGVLVQRTETRGDKRAT